MNQTLKKNITMVGLAVTFNKEGNILMTRRNSPDRAYSHNKWQLPGGMIEYGENPAETATREILEETNIVIDVDDAQAFVASHVFEEVNSHILLVAYKASYVSGEIDFSGDTLHTNGAAWMAYKDIDFSSCLPKTKELIDKARSVQ